MLRRRWNREVARLKSGMMSNDATRSDDLLGVLCRSCTSTFFRRWSSTKRTLFKDCEVVCHGHYSYRGASLPVRRRRTMSLPELCYCDAGPAALPTLERTYPRRDLALAGLIARPTTERLGLVVTDAVSGDSVPPPCGWKTEVHSRRDRPDGPHVAAALARSIDRHIRAVLVTQSDVGDARAVAGPRRRWRAPQVDRGFHRRHSREA